MIKKKINFNNAQAYVLQAYELIMFVVKKTIASSCSWDKRELPRRVFNLSTFWTADSFPFSFPFLFFFFFFYFIRTKNIYIKYACTRITKGSDLLGLVD